MYRSIKDLELSTDKKFHKSPRDWRDEVMYHLIIDRFDNNDPDLEPAVVDSNEATEERDAKAGMGFKGGKLKGVTRRLDYIKSLGCTTLWISPPFKNRQHCEESYHGYAIQNFLEIDPRFGSKEDLQILIKEAHKRKMYVIIDVVINHTGDNWAYASDADAKFSSVQLDFGSWRSADGRLINAETGMELGPEDGVWPVELQSADCYHRRGSIENYEDVEQKQKGDLASLKDLNHEDTKVLDTIIACYKWWLSELDCDGYRIDAAKHCDPAALSKFVNEVREYSLRVGKKNFLLLAEVIGEDEEILKYIGMNSIAEGDKTPEYPHLSACLDFPLHYHLDKVLKGEQPWQVLANRYSSLRKCFRDYGRAGNYLVTFLENHDQIDRSYFRFMSGVTDERLALLGIGYLLLSMGIPCIYYGMEQALDGGGEEGDYYVRETMFGSDWGGRGITHGHLFNEKSRPYRFAKKIAKLRRKEPALKYGRQYFLKTALHEESLVSDELHPNVFAFSRVLDNTSVLVVFNTHTETQQFYVEMDRHFPICKSVEPIYGKGALQCALQYENTASGKIQGRSIKVFKIELPFP